MDNYIAKSPTVVKVGKNKYKIYRNFPVKQAVIQMIGSLEILDDDTGEKEVFQTPTPGWDYEKIS